MKFDFETLTEMCSCIQFLLKIGRKHLSIAKKKISLGLLDHKTPMNYIRCGFDVLLSCVIYCY